MSYSTATKHDGRAVLFAVAELLVDLIVKMFSSVLHSAVEVDSDKNCIMTLNIAV